MLMKSSAKSTAQFRRFGAALVPDMLRASQRHQRLPMQRLVCLEAIPCIPS